MTTKLDRFLEEGLSSDAALWSSKWGRTPGDPGSPRVITRISNQILDGTRGTTVLVSGRYGTGKSSFMRLLRTGIEDGFWARKQALESAPRQVTGVVTCWIHLPVLTASPQNDPIALMVSSVVAALREADSGSDLLSARIGTEKPDAHALQLLEAADGAANAISRVAAPPATSAQEFRPNRSAGAGGSVASQRRAHTVEDQIQRFLAMRKELLVVFLDDLDRCRAGVTVSVIQLLLQMSGQPRIGIVLASDRRMIEHGVDQWMGTNGLGVDGAPVVTANSALEKYVHHAIEMPRLDDVVAPEPNGTFEAFPAHVTDLLKREPASVPSRRADGRRTIMDEFFAQLLRALSVDDLQSPGTRPEPPQGVVALPPPEPGQPEVDGGLKPSTPLTADATTAEADDKPPSKDFSRLKTPRANITEPKVLSENRTALFWVLQAMLEPTLDKDPDVRVVAAYLPIFRYLTLRQVKWFIREICLRPDYEVNEKTTTLWVVVGILLHEIFPPMAALRNTEPQVFSILQSHALRLLRTREPQRAEADLDGFDLRWFKEMLDRVRAVSASLERHGSGEYWPTQPEEQRLLVTLLARHEPDAPSAARAVAMPVASAARLPGLEREPVLPWAGAPDIEPPHTEESVASTDEEVFADWVEERVGERPSGPTIQAQVSSFQDLLVDKLGSSSDATQALAQEYATRFLDVHRRAFTQEIAPSLSNLAVVLDDVVQAEPETDKLFSLAVELNPSELRIKTYYADFLVHVLHDSMRTKNLRDVRYRTNEAIVARARELIEKPYLGEMGALHRHLLMLALDYVELAIGERYKSDALFSRFLDTIPQFGALFRRANRITSYEPFVRFDAMLDLILGKLAESLSRRGQILSALWELLRRDKASTTVVVVHIANLYAGEGSRAAGQEQIGMQLNRHLLLQPDLYTTHARRARQIWSQTAAIMDNGGQVEQERPALGFLASLLLGGGDDPSWTARARSILRKLQGEGGDPAEKLIRALRTEEVKSAWKRAREAREPAQASIGLVPAVFPVAVTSITTPRELADADGWAEEDWERIVTVVTAALPDGGPSVA